MWSYILKRLLLMIPTLFGILLITFVVIQFVPGGRWSRWWRSSRASRRAAKGRRRRRAATAGARAWTPCASRRSEALRLRQAGARALRADDRPVRALRPRQELLPQQGRRAADPREAAGVDQPGAVDLPPRVSARHRQGGARRHAVRHGDDVHRAAGLRHPELRHGRGAARVLRRRLVFPVVPHVALRPSTGTS